MQNNGRLIFHQDFEYTFTANKEANFSSFTEPASQIDIDNEILCSGQGKVEYISEPYQAFNKKTIVKTSHVSTAKLQKEYLIFTDKTIMLPIQSPIPKVLN